MRELGQDDVVGVRAVLADWLDDDVVEEKVPTLLATPHFVAELGGVVVGVSGLAFADGTAEILTTYVARAVRGSGVGTALVDHVESVAIGSGCTSLVVVSGARNREFGYAFWRRRYGEHAQWDDDYFGAGAERVIWRAKLPR